MTIPSQDLKMCNRCKAVKPRGDFYMRNTGYIHSECKECAKGRSATTRLRNGDRMKPYYNAKAKEYRIAVKEAVFKHYGGFMCACCGETERQFLTLDHVANDGADFRRTIAGRQTAAGHITYRWLFRNGFPAGYQVLCANCQHGKRMNKGICPHQVRCNDYPLVGVGASAPKLSAPVA